MRVMPKTEGGNYSMGLRGPDAVILEPGVVSGTGLLALKANHSTEIGGADVGAVKTQQSTDRSEVHNLRTSKRPATIYCRESRACEKGILQARLDIALKQLSLQS
ncbi:hypothetical protein CGCVW01_v009749 [Colletotrichum viniferum]|nr:hypothetical protein CGCVW01_v009749 [Colletotrichum viniferum]